MLNFTKGNSETFYFTGTELATLVNPYFLFAFTNRVTTEVVKVMCSNTSTHTERYDKASILIDTYFTDKETGLWAYEVYEKADDTDMTLTGTIVERGYMNLITETPFEPVEYSEQSNTFKTYGG